MKTIGQEHEFLTRGGKAFAPVIDLPAVLCVRDIRHETLDRDMQTFKRNGWSRVYVIVANDGNPFYANPWISTMSYAEGQPNSYMQHNYDQLGDPNAAVVAAAKRAGLEVWAVYKPYEGGGYTIPASGHAAGSLAEIPTLGGLLVYNDRFLSENPQFRLKRKPEVDRSEGSPIRRIEVTYMLDEFTNVVGPAGRSVTHGRIDEGDLEPSGFDIYVSDDNGNYTLLGNFSAEYRVERRDIRDPNGFILSEDSRCMVAVIEGFEIPVDTHYLAIVPEHAGNRRLIPQTMIRAFAANGEEAPLTVSRYYRSPLFREWQTNRPADYQWGREVSPRNVWSEGAVENFQQWGFVFDWHGIGFWGDGWLLNPPLLGLARGKLDYLKGTHCEGYPEVREYWLESVKSFIDMGFDGIDFRLQYHCGMISDYVNYGFNTPIVERYKEVYGIDITKLESIDEETALNIMKVRGEFFMEFLEDAVKTLQASGRKAGIHLRYSNEDPELSYDFNEMGFWAMPRVILDWQKAVDLADEVTVKDYYHNNYRKGMSEQIKQYAYDSGKFIWVHAYYQQGGEANNQFFQAVDADPQVGGILGYELYLGAGQAIVDSFVRVLDEMDYSREDGQKPEFLTEPLPLVAYEGFWTVFPFTVSGRAAHYFDGQSIGSRKAVMEGTVGFPFHPSDHRFHWIGEADAFRTAIDAALHHEGVAWPNPGGLIIGGQSLESHQRYARKITAPIPDAKAYYMSALIQTADIGNGPGLHKAFRSVGFGHSRGKDIEFTTPGGFNNLEKGFHVGVVHENGRGYLAAFTGSDVFKLTKLDDSKENKTVQIVLKLDVNRDGNDYLTAWYSPQGTIGLIPVLAVNSLNVGNVWQSVEDISCLLITNQNTQQTETRVDEIHLGTTMESVTTLRPFQ